jgi:hypothetical protein
VFGISIAVISVLIVLGVFCWIRRGLANGSLVMVRGFNRDYIFSRGDPRIEQYRRMNGTLLKDPNNYGLFDG